MRKPVEARALKVPRLWRTRDPRKLVSMGQLEFPGLRIENSQTSEHAWAELESDTRRDNGLINIR